MGAAKAAKATAPVEKKTQKATGKKTSQQGGGLRLVTWQPGSETDGGRPLEPQTRLAMESRFGHDFGRVRIHTGPEADRSAAGLGAHAYTLGLDVRFRQGRYRPDTPAGRALLVHELEHVVRAGARGPAVPKLQPDPAAVDAAKLEEILNTSKKRREDFKKYVAAHPQSIEAAETLLVRWKPGRKNLGELNEKAALLGILSQMDGKSEARVLEKIRRETVELRQQASVKTDVMWNNYRGAAFRYAWLQWATKRLADEKLKRLQSAKGAKSGPAAMEQQLEVWKVELQRQLDAVTADRTRLFTEYSAAVTAMVDAARPLAHAQTDMIDDLTKRLHGTMSAARQIRLDTYADTSLLELQKTPWVASQLGLANQRLDQARKAEEKARTNRTNLESAPAPATSPTRAQKAQSERQLAAAKAAEAKAVAGRQGAEKALTASGTNDPLVRQYLESQDPAKRAAAEKRLEPARKIRNLALKSSEPKTHLFAPLVAVTDKDLWWVYHAALNAMEQGFPNYNQERTALVLVNLRTEIAANLKAPGVEGGAPFTTYPDHGPGQYDLHAGAGEDIVAVHPETIDLTDLFDRGSSTRRIFTHVSGIVQSADVLKESTANDDVQAKLIHGYFGFYESNRKKIATYLEGQGGAKPAPDVSRLLGALMYDNTIAGHPPSPDVAADLKDIRDNLEAALHVEMEKLGPFDAKVAILRMANAGSGGTSPANTVTKEAVEEIRKITSKPKMLANTANDLVYAAVKRVVLDDAAISGGLEALIKKLLDQGFIGNRSGPWVTLLHRYKETATGEEAWIAVDYRHLHSVNVKNWEALGAQTTIGKVGVSGNSVTPHIHMAIRVYKTDPRNPNALYYNTLLPDEFFPYGRKRAKP